MPYPKYEFRITRNGEEYYCHYDGQQELLFSNDNPDEILATLSVNANISISVFIFLEDKEASWASIYVGFDTDIVIPDGECIFIYDY